MRNIGLLFWLLFGIENLYCQTNFNKAWLQGTNFQFRTSFTLTSHTNFFIDTSFLYFSDGASNICDSNGNLILCSDGFNLYDSNLNFIEGGDTLVPEQYFIFDDGFSSYSQSSIILPFEDKVYYLITATCSDTNLANVWLATGSNKAPFDLLLANKIDMKANGGAGKVVERMKPIVQGEYISKTQMMAVKHSNGKDWWLLKMMHDSVSVYTFLITKDSIHNHGKQSFPYPRKTASGGNYFEIMGQMQISPDGTKFATTCNNTHNELFLADFDRCYGKLSNFTKKNIPVLPTNFPVSINDPDDKYSTGLCFSPNGRFIYTINYANIQQYDTQDPDSSTAWYHVANMDTTYDYFMGYVDAYLGFDSKLYIGNWHGFSDAMSVINNPDIKGVGCNWCRKCMRFTHIGVSNPPCQPNYDLGEKVCYPDGVDEDIKQEPDFLLYPNPANTNVTIKYNIADNSKALLQLFDMLGNKVKEITLSSRVQYLLFDVSDLVNGMYTYKYIVDNKYVSAGKLVIEK